MSNSPTKKDKGVQQHKYMLESGLFNHKVVQDKRRKTLMKPVPKNKLLEELYGGKEPTDT